METTHLEGIQQLRGLINRGDVAMLCTIHEDHIRSRPMATSDIDEEGNIWFFTDEHSHTTQQLNKNHRITLSYSDHLNGIYLCLNGSASVVKDKNKMEKLFNAVAYEFFPKGLDDPKIALLKVEPKHAEYWDSRDNTMVNFIGILGSSLTEHLQAHISHKEIDL
ncbi:MAG: pyridoxamine 5'-phosphate oxidase family protein [Pyrinomonadaceae bacterium]|nr:pyridoxamine 5'-phosphate oxidase family protein [Sphingobacteriaceae bacterium]